MSPDIHVNLEIIGGIRQGGPSAELVAGAGWGPENREGQARSICMNTGKGKMKGSGYSTKVLCSPRYGS